MPIYSGGSGGGGLPTGWTQNGSPADVATAGGHLELSSGNDSSVVSRFGHFVGGASAFIEVDSATGSIFVAQNAGIGEVIIGTDVSAAPPDGDLVAKQLALWFDSTNGAAKLMLKGKTANGTVVAASVALA